MPDFNAGDVGVDVHPDLTGFSAELERGLTRATSGSDVRVPVEFDVSRQSITSLKRQIRAVNADGVEIPVAFAVNKSKLAALQRQIRQIADVTVPVALSANRAAVNRLQRDIRAFGAVTMPVELSTTRASVNRLGREVRAIGSITVPAAFDPTQVARAFNTAARTAAPLINPVTVRVDFDSTQAVNELASTVRMLETSAPKIDLDVDVDTAKIAAAGTAAGTDFSKGFRTAATGATLASTAVLATSAAAFGAVAVTTANFEEQLSELGAVSSATAAQMKQLSDQALQAGADTSFSASEAAQAQTELAKAGLSVDQILGGALTGTLGLAAAGNIELADAAIVSANALNAFNLSGDQTSHVADLLAAAANKSAADVSDIAPALQQSALAAAQMGLTLEETTGGLAAFAQAGLKGSDAGTSFKTFLQRLVPQTKEASTAMQQLGLNFFDSNGKFVGLAETAGQLRGALSGLTDEQRTAALQTLFGSDAIRAASVIYQEGASGIDQWVTSVNDAGFATETAATKLDNLKGDVEALRGSLETVAIGAGLGSSSGLRVFVQDLTQFVNQAGPLLLQVVNPFGSLVSTILPQLVPLLTPLAAIIGTVTGGFGELLSRIMPVVYVLANSLAGAVTELAPAFTTALAALTPVFDVISSIVKIGVDAFGGLAATVLPVVAEMFGVVASAIQPVVEALAPIVDEIVPVLGQAFADLFAAVEPLIPVMGDGLLKIVEALGPTLPVLVDVFVQLVEGVMVPLLPLLTLAVAGFASLTAELVRIKPFVVAVGLAFLAYKTYGLVVTGLSAALKLLAAAQLALNAVMSANPIGLIVAAVAALAAGIYLAYRRFEPFRNIVDSIGDVFQTLWGVIMDGVEAALPVLKNIWDLFYSLNIGPIVAAFKALAAVFTGDFGKAGDIIGDAFSSIGDAFGAVLDDLGNILSSIGGWITGTAVPYLVEQAPVWAEAFFGWLGTAAVWLGEKLAGVLSAIGTWIVGTAIPWLLEKGVELAAAFGGWLVDMAVQIPGKLFGVITAIGTWVFGTAVPWLLEQGAHLASAFIGWVIDAAIGLPLKLAEWLASFGVWIVTTAIPWLLQKGAELAVSFGQWITDTIVGLPGKLWEWLTAFGSWITTTAIPAIAGKAAEIASSFLGWIADVITSLPGKLESIATTIFDFITSIPGRIAGAAKNIGSAIWNGIVDGVTGAASAIGDIASKLWEGLKGLINDNLIRPIREFEVFGGHPFGSFPYLAEGAIVSKPTLAMIGEAGPELVLPLSNPDRIAALIQDATAAGLIPPAAVPSATGVTAPMPDMPVAAGVAGPATVVPFPTVDTSAIGAASGPLLAVEPVQTWADQITAIMAALPVTVTEQTVPLWTLWADTTIALFARWSGALTQINTDLWARVTAQQAASLATMHTQLSASLTAMETTAATGAARIGAALNNGLNAAINTAVLKVQDYGSKLAAAINPVLAAIGQPPVVLRFATGGHVPGPNVNADVVPAMLTPGEYVVRKQVVDRIGRDRFDALNNGQVQYFATGGSVLPADAVNRAQTFARAQNGEPYVWGSSGPDGFDCSGFWSAIINTIREPGRNPYRRLFNTASLIDGGWRNVGLLPGLGQVSVGAFKGDPGHMAGTIAGLNAESRGSAGVVVGPRARGAADRLFTNTYHMGNGLYLGSDGSVYQIPDPYKLGKGWINFTAEKYMQHVHAKTKPWVDANTYTSNITAGMVATEPGVALASGWLPATSGRISEFGGPGDINSLAVTGGSTANPPLGPYYAAMRWQSRQYSQLKNNRLKAVLPRTGRAVVMYPGDWGPAQWTGRVLDISPAAMAALGGRTDDVVNISAVAANSRTGPVPVMHTGGVYQNPDRGEGLVVLAHREEVLTPGDPRHIDNLGAELVPARNGPGEFHDPGFVRAVDRLADTITSNTGRGGDTINVVAPAGTRDPEHWAAIVGRRIKNARG